MPVGGAFVGEAVVVGVVDALISVRVDGSGVADWLTGVDATVALGLGMAVGVSVCANAGIDEEN